MTYPDSGMDHTIAITDRGDPHDQDPDVIAFDRETRELAEAQADADAESSVRNAAAFERQEIRDSWTLADVLRDVAPTPLKNFEIANRDVSEEFRAVYVEYISGTHSIYGLVDPTKTCDKFGYRALRSNDTEFIDQITSIILHSDRWWHGIPDHTSLTTDAIGADGRASKNPSESVGYIMRIGRQDYPEHVAVELFPKNRTQLETLHRAATSALREGMTWDKIQELVLRLSPEVGIRAESFREEYVSADVRAPLCGLQKP